MPAINWDDQDDKDRKTIDGIAIGRAYQAQIPDGNGNLIPNPQSKKQFATKFLRNICREFRELAAIAPLQEAVAAERKRQKEQDPPEE